jgi:hypothetical protein
VVFLEVVFLWSFTFFSALSWGFPPFSGAPFNGGEAPVGWVVFLGVSLNKGGESSPQGGGMGDRIGKAQVWCLGYIVRSGSKGKNSR